MKGKARAIRLGILLSALAFLTVSYGCASLQIGTNTEQTAKQAQPSEKPAPAPVQPQPVSTAFPIQAPYFPAPSTMDLCGEPVPLHMQEVYERFDKEFTLIVYNHAQVYLWLKRMERWFPMIEERLRALNLPDDLKWVAIVESDLVPNVCSPKGAAGPWQFMPSTGSAYGLEQRGSVDKRYDFERATDSAFTFLNDLHRQYRSWSLAIAAYNCGGKRISDEARNSGTRDYYHMKLPQETERYVMRILAIKAVLGNPRQYGYDLPKGWGYQELKVDRVSVSLSRPASVQTLSNAAGITYREFKRLNPVFRSDDIPAGTHEVKLPAGFGKVFEANFKSGSAQEAPAPAPAASAVKAASEREDPAPSAASAKAQPAKAQPVKEKSYTVKKGDTLSTIARSFSTSTQALKQANKLKSDDLAPGQKLRIP
ncbi:MAG: LysM peptidoglycan-binding domain-containing protein [Syntrophobacteraceae bacterium]